jgi:hypothetical protein
MGEFSVDISPDSEIQRPPMVGMDAPRSPLSVGGLMARFVAVGISCVGPILTAFLAPIDGQFVAYDVAGVAIG